MTRSRLPRRSRTQLTTRHEAAVAEKSFEVSFDDCYRVAFEQVRTLIGQCNNALSEADCHTFSHVLCLRLLSLRFLESRGWLRCHGRSDGLQAIFERGGMNGQSVYQKALRTLFFRRTDINAARPNCGLFTQSHLDRQGIQVPDAALELLIGAGGLFYRFRFSWDELTSRESRADVTPQILGRVHEQFSPARRSSGSYYTPDSIVSYLCRQGLKSFLSTRTEVSADLVAGLVDEGTATGLTATEASTLLETLKNVRVVDPACGSGALLIGFVREAMAIFRCLSSLHKERRETDIGEFQRHVLAQCIHGADVDPLAVQVTEMRLWLLAASFATDVEQLRDLSFQIKAGDSLLGASHAQETPLPPECGAIHWHAVFPAAMNCQGGFDIVLANPPYVDSETMVLTMPRYRRQVAERFAVARGNWDLYIPFTQRCVELVRPGGCAVLITPSKWLSISYGKSLRRYLTGMLRLLADYTHFRAFENLGVSPIAFVVEKLPERPIAIERYRNVDQLAARVTVPANFLSTHDLDWGILLSENLDLVRRCAKSCRKLGALCDVESAGSVAQAYELSEHIHENPHPTESEFRLLNTGTIDPYEALWGRIDTTYLKQKYRHPCVTKDVYKLVFPRRFAQMASPKIIVTGIRHFEAFFDATGDWLAGKSTVVLRDASEDWLVLLAVLNSAFASFFFKEWYGSLGMDGGISFTPANVRELPVPYFSDDQAARLRNLVGTLIDSGVSKQPPVASVLLNEIDEIVFVALDLVPTDIERIQGRISRRRQRL